MFVELEPLLKSCDGLKLALKMKGEAMVVVVMPEGEAKDTALRQPLVMTATAAELDAGFAEHLATYTGAHASLAEQVIEAAGNVEVLTQSFEESEAGEPATDGSMQGDADRTGGADGDDGGLTGQPEPEETLEDKRHRMSDLLNRLGISQPDRQQSFRKYAHVTYGRGWAERPADVDQMNARLAAALDNPVVFDDEMKQANSFV